MAVSAAMVSRYFVITVVTPKGHAPHGRCLATEEMAANFESLVVEFVILSIAIQMLFQESL
jgi:hypothetical protein